MCGISTGCPTGVKCAERADQRRVQLRSAIRLYVAQQALAARDPGAICRHERTGAAAPDQPVRAFVEHEQPEVIGRAQRSEQQAAGTRG